MARAGARRAAGVVTTAGLGYLALVDPAVPGRYPSCPWRSLTGLWCPGCGGLRAVHELLHGHLAAALGLNALVVAGVGLLVILGAARAVRQLELSAARALQGRVPHLTTVVPSPGRPVVPGSSRTAAGIPMARAVVVGCAVALVVAFGVLRNLPVAVALAP